VFIDWCSLLLDCKFNTVWLTKKSVAGIGMSLVLYEEGDSVEVG